MTLLRRDLFLSSCFLRLACPAHPTQALHLVSETGCVLPCILQTPLLSSPCHLYSH